MNVSAEATIYFTTIKFVTGYVVHGAIGFVLGLALSLSFSFFLSLFLFLLSDDFFVLRFSKLPADCRRKGVGSCCRYFAPCLPCGVHKAAPEYSSYVLSLRESWTANPQGSEEETYCERVKCGGVRYSHLYWHPEKHRPSSHKGSVSRKGSF